MSSRDATKSYFNIDYEPVKDLKAKILASTGQTPATLLPPSQKTFVSTEESTVTEATIQEILDSVTTIQEILDAELPPGKKVTNLPHNDTVYKLIYLLFTNMLFMVQRSCASYVRRKSRMSPNMMGGTTMPAQNVLARFVSVSTCTEEFTAYKQR